MKNFVFYMEIIGFLKGLLLCDESVYDIMCLLRKYCCFVNMSMQSLVSLRKYVRVLMKPSIKSWVSLKTYWFFDELVYGIIGFLVTLCFV